MRLLASFFISFLICLIDARSIQSLVASVDNNVKKIEFESPCHGLIKLRIARSDGRYRFLDETYDCNSIDQIIRTSRYLVLNFAAFDGFLNLDGNEIRIRPGVDIPIVLNSFGKYYIFLRLIITFLLIYYLISVKKISANLLFPVVLSSTIFLLYYPGGFSLDIFDYYKSYLDFPVIDDEYSLVRLLPFFFINFIFADIMAYKIFQFLLCSYSIFYLNILLFKRSWFFFSSLLCLASSAFALSALSYTDLIFTGLLLLKISFAIELFRTRLRKHLIKFVLISIVVAIYRTNALGLLLFDVAFLLYLQYSWKVISSFMIGLIICLVGQSTIFPISKTGYYTYAMFYELAPIKDKYKELNWIDQYVKVEAQNSQQTSLIRQFYRGSDFQGDLLERELLTKDHEFVLKKYLDFGFHYPLELIKQKMRLFGFFLGVGVSHYDEYLFDDGAYYVFKEGGDLSELDKLDYHHYSQFHNLLGSKLKYINFLNRLIFKIESYAYPYLFLMILIMCISFYYKMHETILMGALVLSYTMTFIVFSHGYLLSYSYYISIFFKIMLIHFIYELINHRRKLAL